MLNTIIKLALISFLSLAAPAVVYSQNHSLTTLGIGIGVVKNVYYDESMSFQAHRGLRFNPYNIRFMREKGKNTHLLTLHYIRNSLSPAEYGPSTTHDAITLQTGQLEYYYLRRLDLSFTEKLEFQAGIKWSVSGYGGDRLFRKTYYSPPSQWTYMVSFLSLQPGVQARYSFTEKTSVRLNGSIPILSWNTKGYNMKISPFENIGLVSIKKYAGFNTELALTLKGKRLITELFQLTYFYAYKEPYDRKIFTNETGIRLSYAF